MRFRSVKYSISAVALAAALSGCAENNADRKANAPISAATVKLMEDHGTSPAAPVLMRVVKADSKLEVWKKSAATGKYALLKSYEICKWSGDLGPKKTEGDRQAPEGFYNITPAQMNPNSSFYLSFNTGFPNAYDKSRGYSGSHLMVHGDCSSRGCYAMSDENIAEIYAIARESFRGGQKSFQLQALPFKMNAKNMFKFRNSTNYAFWQNIKEGVDQFEVSGLEPKVDVCSKKYVFNAQGVSGLDPSGPCPSYSIPQDIAAAVSVRKSQEHAELQDLMAQELHKKSSPKLASLLGVHTPSKHGDVDHAVLAKLATKESARAYLPNSSPEAVSLLALRHEELPDDVVTTASISTPINTPALKSTSSKVSAVKAVAPASQKPVTKSQDIRASRTDDAATRAQTASLLGGISFSGVSVPMGNGQ